MTASAQEAGRARAPAATWLAAALAGFGCMAAELTAVRLLAPHFGDSAYVWTNVIGVILASLAAGAWLGGRLACGAQPERWAVRLLAAAAVWTALSPWLARGLGAWLMPADLPLDSAMPAMVRGSFVATAVLFGPAMLWLGAISPLLISATVRGGVEVGRAAGGIAAAGTLGSLVGTFAATHVLVPTLGCRIAMAVAGGVLALAALLVRGGGARRLGGGAAALAALAAVLHHFGGPLRPPPAGAELLEERETPIQFLQVLRERTDGAERTALRINEGLDSFHSLAIAGSAFTGGAYYDWHALAPLLAGNGARPAGLRALSIGDAAGTMRAVYAGVHPGAEVTAVDVDAATMELGDRCFPGAKAAGPRFALDGRVFLEHASEKWHVIHVDAYAHQVYVPAHLASREFFAAAKRCLLPGGVIVCNVGALRADDPVLRAIRGTLREVFGHALSMQVPNSRNALLVAREGEPPDARQLASFVFGAERLSAADAAHWRQIVAAAAVSPWTAAEPGDAVLVDDRPVLDRLLAGSYVDRRDEKVLLACTGTAAPGAAEIDALAARRRPDWVAVLDAVARSSAPTAPLREWAGDARWSLRELRSARAEYADGLALAEDAATRQRLEEKARSVDAELEPVKAAEGAATRNGWLQVAVVVAFAIALAGVRRIG